VNSKTQAPDAPVDARYTPETRERKYRLYAPAYRRNIKGRCTALQWYRRKKRERVTRSEVCAVV